MKRTPLRKVSAKKRAHKATEKAAGALRQNAKGKPCALRLSGCRGDPAYTVLAHLRRNGWGGMGLKPHDVLAVFACDQCHDKQERYHSDCTDTDLLRALGETLLMQISDGLIIVASNPEMIDK
jgi:hypothetical protein